MKTIKQTMVTYSAVLVTVLILAISATLQIQLGILQHHSIETMRTQRTSGYDSEGRAQVQNVVTLLNTVYQQEQSGQLTEAEAQNEAKVLVKGLRYGDDGTGYFWIDSTDYALVAHPILPQNEGQNRHDLKDKNGVMIIQEIMKVVQADQKGGFSEFYFTKAYGVTVSPKRTYSMLFKPWRWVVSSGNYYDDINLDLDAVNGRLNVQFNKTYVFIGLIFIFLFIESLIVAYLFAKKFSKPIVETADSLQKMEQGDLTIRLPSTKIKNEIGRMRTNVNSFVDSMNTMVS